MDLALRNNLKTAKKAFLNNAEGIRNTIIGRPSLTPELKQSLRSLESLYKELAMKIDGVLIQGTLSDLKAPSLNITRATEEMKSAIDTLAKIDQVTKQLANIIKLLGTLASKIVAQDIPGIGAALEPLLGLIAS